jgi:hypothetical protein
MTDATEANLLPAASRAHFKPSNRSQPRGGHDGSLANRYTRLGFPPPPRSRAVLAHYTTSVMAGLRRKEIDLLGRVCKSCLMDNAATFRLKRMMRLRRKVKKLLPKIAEANFHRNRFPGTAIVIVKLAVLLRQCTWCLKVFFVC